MGFAQRAKSRKKEAQRKGKDFTAKFGKRKTVIGKRNKLHQKYSVAKPGLKSRVEAAGTVEGIVTISRKQMKKLQKQKAIEMKKKFRNVNIESSDSWEDYSDSGDSEEVKMEE